MNLVEGEKPKENWEWDEEGQWESREYEEWATLICISILELLEILKWFKEVGSSWLFVKS